MNKIQMDVLSRDEMRNVKGGFAPIETPGCLGCTENKECAAVNKGECTKECKNGKKGCDGW